MEICIDEKTRKNQIYKIVSQFNQQPCEIYQNHLTHDTILRLNSVVGYLNVKNYK